MVSPSAVPDHEGILEILQSEGAPPRMILDLANSEDEQGKLADIDADGLVSVRLNEDGDGLIFEDA